MVTSPVGLRLFHSKELGAPGRTPEGAPGSRGLVFVAFPDWREPMFQLTFDSGLLPLTIQRPASVPLVRLPRPCQDGLAGSLATNPYMCLLKGRLPLALRAHPARPTPERREPTLQYTLPRASPRTNQRPARPPRDK